MIGVCIKYFHENYGGMLQAYATITMLKDRGLNYELIRYKKHYSLYEKVKQIPRIFNAILLNDKKEALIKKIGKKRSPDFLRNERIRIKAFQKFKDEKFVQLSPVFVGYKSLQKGVERYDAVITGSDQLWSPAGLPTNFYNLMFVPQKIRKVSIASSFGVKKIPWYQVSRTRTFLNRIEFISMRENRGKEIVEELTGKIVPVILDPVFFFDIQGWKRLIPENIEVEEPYIFAYFLGKNLSFRTLVTKAASELNCKIVTLRHMDQYIRSDEDFGDYAPYDVDPIRFLNFIRGAKYICTDSFHGSVLSIIHHKPFVVFNRYDDKAKYSKNSRIDTLCANLGLQDRRFDMSVDLKEQLMKQIDYLSVEQKLIILRKKTNEFLDLAFKGLEN